VAGWALLAKVKNAEHGIDLGPLQPRLAEIINTGSGKIELAPALMIDDVARLKWRMSMQDQSMLLIGRRSLRSSNSLMHNLLPLVKGRDVCTLQMAPGDA